MKVTKAQIEAGKAIYSHSVEWRTYREAIKRTFDMSTRNCSIVSVLPKITIIEGLYGTRVNNPHAVANHIISINGLDSMLSRGEPEAIELLRRVPEHPKGKITNMLVFATKFGHFSNKGAYPIYDSFVSKALENLTDWGDFDDSQSHLRTFAHFYEGIDQLRKDNHLNTITPEDLDLFLWPYGQLLTIDANSKINEEDKENKKKKRPVNKELFKMYCAHPELFDGLR